MCRVEHITVMSSLARGDDFRHQLFAELVAHRLTSLMDTFQRLSTPSPPFEFDCITDDASGCGAYVHDVSLSSSAHHSQRLDLLEQAVSRLEHGMSMLLSRLSSLPAAHSCHKTGVFCDNISAPFPLAAVGPLLSGHHDVASQFAPPGIGPSSYQVPSFQPVSLGHSDVNSMCFATQPQIVPVAIGAQCSATQQVLASQASSESSPSLSPSSGFHFVCPLCLRSQMTPKSHCEHLRRVISDGLHNCRFLADHALHNNVLARFQSAESFVRW